MSYQSASHGSSDIRSVMQPRRPAGVGKIEKARDPRRALTGLLRYLGPFKVGLVMVLVCVVIYTLLGLVGPYLMGVAIDRFIAAKATGRTGADCPVDAGRLPVEQPVPGHRRLGDGRHFPESAQAHAPGSVSAFADPAAQLL